jgi:uncharacterized protein YndB with AHSA1/START domain
MKDLVFEVELKATPAQVWHSLWSESQYPRWTRAFCEGSYAVSDWKTGSDILFLGPSGDGMFSKIVENTPLEKMDFMHIGEVKNYVNQQAESEWGENHETYTLIPIENGTLLKVQLQTVDAFESYFNETFPRALTLLKQSVEADTITVEATVMAQANKVWDCWNSPSHVVNWNSASDDWHTPKSENDLVLGGQFKHTMAAKDGSFSFDFVGTYTEITPEKGLKYVMEDGRKAEVMMVSKKDVVQVIVTFDPEQQNPKEIQQGGWQGILNNFKKYVDALSCMPKA